MPTTFTRQQTPARASAALVSLLSHALIILIAIAAVQHGRVMNPANEPPGIVWIAQGPSGDSHGGGGGGNEMQAPPRRVELPGHDSLTVPVEHHTVSVQPPAVIPPDVGPPIAQLDISALRTAAGVETLPGSIDGVPGGTSQGPGRGGGAGKGDGTGDGPGNGPGRGDGWGGNEGGGPVQQGTPGLRDPRLVHEVKPVYTPEAMQARIQGTVELEAVVTTDGTVKSLRVVRSLDALFGLDREAIKAAKDWKFIPGTLRGQPVPVLIRIEIAFALK